MIRIDELAHVCVGQFREAQRWRYLGNVRAILDPNEILLVFDEETSMMPFADVTHIFCPQNAKPRTEFKKEGQGTTRTESVGWIEQKYATMHKLGLHICTEEKRVICHTGVVKYHFGPGKYGPRLKNLNYKSTIFMPRLDSVNEDLSIPDSPSVKSNIWENF